MTRKLIITLVLHPFVSFTLGESYAALKSIYLRDVFIMSVWIGLNCNINNGCAYDCSGYGILYVRMRAQEVQLCQKFEVYSFFAFHVHLAGKFL